MRAVEEFYAKGHGNVLATHQMTWEITRAPDLSKRGDCVVAVGATRGLADLDADFRNLCRNDNARITVELYAAGLTEVIRGRGSSRFTLTHPAEIVGRKSMFVSDRTIMVQADKAACDLGRELVKALSSPDTFVRIRVIVET